MGVEVRSGHVHAVDDVGQSPRKACVGESEPQIEFVAEATSLQKIQCVFFGRHRFELVLGHKQCALRELDLQLGERSR